MASARGVVAATVAGTARRLRLSLLAVDEIEMRTGQSLAAVFKSLGNPETVRFGTVLVLFTEMCAAGGTPLSEEDVASLLPSDLPDIMRALEAVAAQFQGDGEAEGGAKKKSTASRNRSRGGAGKK